MAFSGNRKSLAVCLLMLAGVGFFLREPLMASISYAWANKEKAAKNASKITPECLMAPSEEDYLTKYAEEGYVHAQFTLAKLYANGWDNIPVNYSKAFKWYQAAAEEGQIYPQYVMGALYALDVHEPKKDEKVLEHFKAISSAAGIKPDYAVAAEWWKKAANQGYYQAKYGLSVLYRDGLGLEQHLPEAYFWASLVGHGYEPQFKEHLEQIEKLLRPEEIEAVRKRAADWQPVKVEPKKTKILLNVAGVLCGNRSSWAGWDCHVADRCENIVGIDCTTGSLPTKYYVVDAKTKEILGEDQIGAACKSRRWQ